MKRINRKNLFLNLKLFVYRILTPIQYRCQAICLVIVISNILWKISIFQNDLIKILTWLKSLFLFIFQKITIESSYILEQTRSWKLQFCLSMYDLFMNTRRYRVEDESCTSTGLTLICDIMQFWSTFMAVKYPIHFQVENIY